MRYDLPFTNPKYSLQPGRAKNCLTFPLTCLSMPVRQKRRQFYRDIPNVSRVIKSCNPLYLDGQKWMINLSVSPSPRTQTSQWLSSISCTGSRTRISLDLSTMEKHWKMQSLHRFYEVYASKMEKWCAWGTCNTDSRYPERMGNIIYFIKSPESKQNRAKYP